MEAGAQYAFNDDVMGYATVSTGYKGGGFNARASVPQNVGPYGSETVTSYEAGLKGDFLDSRMRINAAAFFVGLHRYRRHRAPPQRTAPAAARAIQETLGDAEIFGLELETTLLVNEYLSLTSTQVTSTPSGRTSTST